MTIETQDGNQLDTWAAVNYTKAIEGLTNITRALYQKETGKVLDNQRIYQIECKASRVLRDLAEGYVEALTEDE